MEYNPCTKSVFQPLIYNIQYTCSTWWHKSLKINMFLEIWSDANEMIMISYMIHCITMVVHLYELEYISIQKHTNIYVLKIIKDKTS